MEKPITNVKLKFNCQANWDEMANTTGGKNCDLCQKKVFDLTKSSHNDFIKILSENNNSVCGRFTTQQASVSPQILPFWKKWVSAAMVLIGFHLFNNKVVAQNTAPPATAQKASTTNVTSVMLGEVYIAPDPIIHAAPVMGVVAFNKLIRDIVGKNGLLNATISVDMKGNFKEIYIHEFALKDFEMDPSTQKKVEDAFKSVKWKPATRLGRIVNDEFTYLGLLEAN